MITLNHQITNAGYENNKIFSMECIVQKDGTISERTIETLRACYQWDGIDPFDLTDPAFLKGKPVQLVIEHETFEGKLRAKVLYLNPPGFIGGFKMPDSADRKKVMDNYGSRFRALAGGTPPVAKKSAPPPATAPAPAPASDPNAPTATMDECWNELLKAREGTSDAKVTSEWHETVKKLFGDKTNSQITPQEWGRFKASITDDVPY